MMWFLFLFMAWPLAEIALYVTVGAWLGLWVALAIVIGTAFAGVGIIRMQGVQVNLSVRDALRQGRNPGPKMAQGALRVLAGVMLILPGFMTDVLGLILLLPPVQIALMALVSRQAMTRTARRRAPADVPDNVIEGEWKSIDADPHAPSGWTRH